MVCLAMKLAVCKSCRIRPQDWSQTLKSVTISQLHSLALCTGKNHFQDLNIRFQSRQGCLPCLSPAPCSAARAGAAPQLTNVMSRTKSAGDRAYSVSAPRLWNDLPVHLRSHTEFASFKRSLKTHLFTLFYK